MVDRRSRIRSNMRRMWLLGAAAAAASATASTSINPAVYFESGTYTGGWIDGTDLSRMRQSSDGTTAVALGDVVGWYNNKAGNSGQFIQGTLALKPTYVSVTGGAALRFASAGNQLVGSAGINTWADGVSAYTIILVLEEATNQWIFRTTAGLARLSTYVNGGTSLTFAVSSIAEMSYPAPVSTRTVWSMTGSGTSHEMRLNGSLVSSTTTAMPTMTGETWVLGHNGADATMDVCHVYFINRAFDAATLDSLSKRLGSDYGVTWYLRGKIGCH